MTPQHDQIDFQSLAKLIWINRTIVLLGTTLSCVIFSGYAFFIAAPVYESTALLIPVHASAGTDQIGAAAALLNGKSNTSSGDAALYQNLLTSRTVIGKLLNANIKNNSDTGRNLPEPLYRILKIDTSSPVEVDNSVSYLAKSVTVNSRDFSSGGILEIKVTASNPWLAQQIGNELLEIGQEELRLVRIARSNIVIPRLLASAQKANREWDSAAKSLAFFQDRNRSITVPGQRLILDRLEVDKQAKEQKYLLAQREYETQILESIKATPPMMILDPANLPSKRSKPNRKLLIILGGGLGLAVSVGSILGWSTIQGLRKN